MHAVHTRMGCRGWCNLAVVHPDLQTTPFKAEDPFQIDQMPHNKTKPPAACAHGPHAHAKSPKPSTTKPEQVAQRDRTALTVGSLKVAHSLMRGLNSLNMNSDHSTKRGMFSSLEKPPRSSNLAWDRQM